MKNIYFIIFILASNVYGLSQNAKDGEEVFVEANCSSCHNKGNQYDSRQYNVSNAFELKQWVSSCATFFNVSWFPEEQQVVIDYLNEIRYKYPKN